LLASCPNSSKQPTVPTPSSTQKLAKTIIPNRALAGKPVCFLKIRLAIFSSVKEALTVFVTLLQKKYTKL